MCEYGHCMETRALTSTVRAMAIGTLHETLVQLLYLSPTSAPMPFLLQNHVITWHYTEREEALFLLSLLFSCYVFVLYLESPSLVPQLIFIVLESLKSDLVSQSTCISNRRPLVTNLVQREQSFCYFCTSVLKNHIMTEDSRIKSSKDILTCSPRPHFLGQR